MSFASKIAYNVVFNSIAKVSATALALVGIGLMTRYLGKGGFGDYSTVMAFFAFFSAISDLGLYSVGTREISREGADESRIISNVFTLRVIINLIVILFAPILVFFLPYPNEVRLGIIFISGAFLFATSYIVLNGVFQKHLSMYKVTFIELIGKAIQVSLIYYVIQRDLGFSAIILAYVASTIFSCLSVIVLSRKYVKLKPNIDWEYWKKFLHQSLPMGGAVIVTFLYFKLDTILLSVLGTSEDVGIYNAAYKIIENLTFFPAMVIGLILPVTSQYIFTNKSKFEELSNKTFKLFVILVVPLIVGTMFLASDIINVIGGVGFVESVLVLRILILALVCIFFGHFFNNILLAGNLQKDLMKVLSVCAAFNIILNSFLISFFSYLGAAVTSVLTEILVVVLTYGLVVRKLKYRPKLENAFKIVLGAALMAGVFIGLANFHFIISGLVATAVYFVVLIVMKVVNKDEIMMMVKRK